jgi:adenine-specific DNA-methyltransferase
MDISESAGGVVAEAARTGMSAAISDASVARRHSDAALLESAACLAYAVTLGWWRGCLDALGGEALPILAPPAGIAGGLRDMAAFAAGEQQGQRLAGLPVGEASAAIGTLYTQALPGAHRSANGIFYTPPPIVRWLLDRAEASGHDWRLGRVVDPSCGGGAFLVEAAARMAEALDGAEPAIVLAALATRLRGWDIDPFAVWLANVSVEVVALRLVIACGRRLGAVADVRDPLVDFDGERGRYQLVIGNPPFGKVKDSAALRARFGRSLHGHPNLYGVFIDLAVHLAAAERGRIAYLIPPSFLGGAYFKALRRVLRRHAAPVSIDLMDSRSGVFDDVLQEVALSVFERGRVSDTVQCAVLEVSGGALRGVDAGSAALPKDPDAPWTLPRHPGDGDFVARLAVMPARLADWGYRVSTGPLVWNRHKSRLHHAPGAGRVPVVWAEAVTQEGAFVWRTDRRNHAAWFAPAHAGDPNLVRHGCVLVQRTTAKEQKRRLVSAEMPACFVAAHGGVVAVENHLNMVVPATPKPRVPMQALARFLATGTADRVLRCINASVAVSASELAAMPLPAADALMAAMRSEDVEAAVAGLYGAIA